MSLHHESWKNNVIQQLEKVCLEIDRLILIQDSEQRSAKSATIKAQFSAIKLMFHAPPTEVSDIESKLHSFMVNQSNPRVFDALIHSRNALKSYISNGDFDQSSEKVSFQSYWQEEGIEEEFEKIIEVLQKILDEAGDELTTKITRELEAILNGLKSVDRSDPYTMHAWVEIAARFALEVLGHQQQIPALSMIVDVVKASQGFKEKVFAAVQNFELALTNTYELKGTSMSIENNPALDKESLIAEIESKQ